jgi:phosphatidylinositol glycan class B
MTPRAPGAEGISQRIEWTRPVVLLVASILLLAFLLRLGAAVMLPNNNHPDEIFQTLEPAHRLAYGYGVVTWEYREGLRSWAFPAFLAGIMRATDWMGAGSTGYLVGIAVVLSTISLTTVWFGFIWARRASGMTAGFIAAATCAFWYELVYYAPKALNEVLAGHLLLPGVYLSAYADSRRQRASFFVSGLFCGLAVALRPPLIPAVAFIAVWSSRTDWRARLSPMMLGILLPVAIFGLIDTVTWSYPFQSFIRYFWVNIVEGKSAIFGVAPWHWYFSTLARRLGPMALLALAGMRRSPYLGWVAVVILLSHTLIPHKEERFLYPLLPLVLTLAAIGLTDVTSTLILRVRLRDSMVAVGVISVLLSAAMSVFLAGRFHMWLRNSGSLVEMQELSRDNAVCGVGLLGISWFRSGGYTHLHRNVPILLISNASDEKKLAPSLNAVVTNYPLRDPRFAQVSCWKGTCVYRRSGSCQPPSPGYDINDVIRRGGG